MSQNVKERETERRKEGRRESVEEKETEAGEGDVKRLKQGVVLREEDE